MNGMDFTKSNWITLTADEPCAEFDAAVGIIPDMKRFVCCYRKQPFFMDVLSGDHTAQIPRETQALFVEHTDGTQSVLLPLVDEPFRVSLWGRADGVLMATVESGDKAVIGRSCRGLYIARGRRVYDLMDQAAVQISSTLKTCRPRSAKPVPEMADWFGWCTWDSFYEKVTERDIPAGLEGFRKGGFVPKFLLLDDGWQSVRPDGAHRGEHKLSSFAPNEKFRGSLADTIALARQEYGVRLFYVWHAVMGYWGGSDPLSPEMRPYNIRLKETALSRTMYLVNPERSKGQEFPFGMAAEDKLFDYYNDYHRSLRQQGVDGVKVDVQAAIEGLGVGDGGRVTLARRVRESLEDSAGRHFGGGLLNCMSCSNDMIYHTKASNLMRSSDDFFPNQPLSHGRHIYTNAVVSVWMGAFTLCDWDMFQTKHEFAEVHAMARAVSGGPVYVSDRVDEHDFSVIRKLTTGDGRILRAKGVGRPTADTLFADPYQNGLLKIFNCNTAGGVVAAFNLTEQFQTGSVSPSDVYGITPGDYVIYDHKSGAAVRCAWEDRIPVGLQPVQSAIFTVTPVKNGFAPVGLAEKYNAGGAIESFDAVRADCFAVTCRGEGAFVFYSENPAAVLILNGKKIAPADREEIAPGLYQVMI